MDVHSLEIMATKRLCVDAMSSSRSSDTLTTLLLLKLSERDALFLYSRRLDDGSAQHGCVSRKQEQLHCPIATIQEDRQVGAHNSTKKLHLHQTGSDAGDPQT